MTAASKLRGISGAAAAAYNPLTELTWFDAWWAEDPAWTPPSELGNITTLNGNGTDGTDWTVATPNTRVRYTSSASDLNNQPAVDHTAAGSSTISHYPKATFGSTLTESWSVVVIGVAENTNVRYHTDGIVATAYTRAVVSSDGTDFGFFTGAWTTGPTADTDAHLFVGVSPSAGDNKLLVDGALWESSTAAGTLTGSVLGSTTSGRRERGCSATRRSSATTAGMLPRTALGATLKHGRKTTTD